MQKSISTLLFLAVLASSIRAQTGEWRNFTSGNTVSNLAWEGQTAWIATPGGLVRYDNVTGDVQCFNRANSGLPINKVYDVEVTPDGVKWLGTQLGLVRYDGTDWQLFNPVSDDPIFGYLLDAWQIESDAAGDIWVIAQKETFWRWHNDEWTRYDQSSFFESNGLGKMMRGTDGAIWLVYPGPSVYRFDGLGDPELLALNGLPTSATGDIEDLFLDAQNRFWINVEDYGFLEISGLNVTPHPLTVYGNGEFVVTPDSTLWIGEYNLSMSRINADSEEETFYAPSPNYSAYILDLQTDPDGNPMMLSESGLWRLKDEALTRLPTSNSGLGTNIIVDLAAGPNGEVWISDDTYDFLSPTWGHFPVHLNRYQNGDWQRWSWEEPPTEIPLHVTDIATDGQGKLWMSAYNNDLSLSSYDGTSWTNYALPDLLWGYATCVACDPWQQAVWVGGRDKIVRWQNGSTEAFDTPFDDADILQIAPAADGRVWVISRYGEQAAFLENGAWTVVDATEMGLPESTFYFTQIAVAPNGDVWVMGNSGIARFDGANWEAFTYDNTGTPLVYFGSAIAFDGDKVWVGFYDTYCFTPNTQFCLLKIEGDAWTYYWFEDTGLPFPTINALAVDTYHNVWVGTDSGLGVFNETQLVLSGSEPGRHRPLPALHITVSPNPAATQTQVSTELAGKSDVKVSLLSADGTLLRQLDYPAQPAGKWQATLATGDLAQGSYFFRLETSFGATGGKLIVGR